MLLQVFEKTASTKKFKSSLQKQLFFSIHKVGLPSLRFNQGPASEHVIATDFLLPGCVCWFSLCSRVMNAVHWCPAGDRGSLQPYCPWALQNSGQLSLLRILLWAALSMLKGKLKWTFEECSGFVAIGKPGDSLLLMALGWSLRNLWACRQVGQIALLFCASSGGLFVLPLDASLIHGKS